MFPIYWKPFVAISCFDGHPVPEGETSQSQPIGISYPEIPGDMFGVEVTHHNGGGWRDSKENAVNFCFG